MQQFQQSILLSLLAIKEFKTEKTEQTFLKTSRLHEMLPKHSRLTGSCAMIMIVGSNRLILRGNKYQSNCSMIRSISVNALPNLWLSSQVMNKIPSPQQATNIVSNNANRSISSFDWNLIELHLFIQMHQHFCRIKTLNT